VGVTPFLKRNPIVQHWYLQAGWYGHLRKEGVIFLCLLDFLLVFSSSRSLVTKAIKTQNGDDYKITTQLAL
jgi:hypothetical protein